MFEFEGILRIGQDVEVRINNRRESQKFCVVNVRNHVIHLKAHEIGEEEVYDLSIKLLHK